MLTCLSSKGHGLRFVIGGFRSVCFGVCFVFQGSLLCDRPVSGINRLVKFASQIFLIFLFLSLTRIKQRMPPSFDKKSTHHRDFLRYS